MKRVVGLTIGALAIIGVAGGSTYAYFSDTETSTSTLAAGSLNLVATASGTSSTPHVVLTAVGDGINSNVTFTKTKRGDSGSITWTLTNNGDLAGTLTMASSNVTFNDNDGTQKKPETKAIAANGGVNLGLGDLMGVRLKNGATYVLGDAANYVPFSGLQAALRAQNQAMAAGGSIVYTLEWALAKDLKKAGADAKFGTADDVDVNDDIIQGDTATIDTTFTLTRS